MTLKVIPGLLFLYPLVRKEYRAARGWAVGCAVGLVSPLVGLGFDGTAAAYRTFVDRILLPGSLSAGDRSMGGELTNVAATDSQSFLSVIHNNLTRTEREPASASAETRLAHWGVVGVLAAVICSVSVRRRDGRTDRSADPARPSDAAHAARDAGQPHALLRVRLAAGGRVVVERHGRSAR